MENNEAGDPRHDALVALLTERLDRAFRFREADRAVVWLGVARRLARGELVPASSLDAGRLRVLRDFECTEWEDGAVAGSIISARPTPHRIRHPGGEAWTWCVFDALLAGLILPGPLTMRSTCPVTGEEVGLRVSAGRAEGEGLVTLPARFAPGGDLRRDFCCRARLWSRRGEAADVAWLGVPEAMAVTRRVAEGLGLIGDGVSDPPTNAERITVR